jgi:hypothetical protein
MNIRVSSLILLTVSGCDSAKQQPKQTVCPTAAVSLVRILSDTKLDGCEVHTSGYFAPSERAALYLSSEDRDSYNEPSSVPVSLPMGQDDGGYWIAVDGQRWSDWEGARLLGLRGTVVWTQDVPTISNGHDLDHWPTLNEPAYPANSRPVKNP